MASVALGAVALLAAGGVTGAVLAPERAPTTLVGTSAPARVPVGHERFDDARTVTVAVERSPSTPLTVRDEGLVTRSACAPGTVLASGTSPFTVDDRPVVALATSQPLWRDLGAGARGPDVTALQEELARLGHPVRADGTYGRATAAAVTSLLRGLGVDRPTGALAARSVLWLPAPQVTVGECAVGPGQTVGTEPVATTAAAVTALTLTEQPAGLVPGDRVVRSNGAQAPVGADGRVTDPALVAAFTASPEWRHAQDGSGQDPQQTASPAATVEHALATPVDAHVVPPSAVYDLADERGCVLGDAGPVAVRVVASSLGTTLVVAEDAVPAHVQAPPAETPPCR
ncbi:peptidoglycan-binding protein [Cellulomonas sp. NPDC057328]|uniref:peptidoglycan-binding domain-containing protein n=1 Tax=Cellulomonas sp. NPDC057328 TaxID=3346101 RepID=UPI0036336345